jgi:mannose/fructose/N-acetylgalactosamine-specific phosphotransferase system component IIB
MRVDDRMIHGQVAIAWSKSLALANLLVVNDACANNKTQKMALLMAGPPSSKTSVITVEQAIKSLNDPRTHDLVIGIIVTNLEDALTLAKSATSEITRVNLGNYGRLKAGNMGVQGKKVLTNNVYVDEDDLKVIQAIRDTGIPVDVQLLPYTAMVTIEEALK